MIGLGVYPLKARGILLRFQHQLNGVGRGSRGAERRGRSLGIDAPNQAYSSGELAMMQHAYGPPPVFCQRCQMPTTTQVLPGQPFNHTPHILGTVFLCGLWAPIWIIAAMTHKAPHRVVCTRCGTQLATSARR